MYFKLNAAYQPTGDQPEAIAKLTQGIIAGEAYQTLMGVTGSGKTFTVANVLANVQRPALVLSHNKTLAAQLYSEFKQFFPDNLVEYFVSYYDYYQPEAYLPITDTYIEKDLSINDEIEKLRLSTTSALLSGRKDVIVVSSVSCLYGIGNPKDFHDNGIRLFRGQNIGRNIFLRKLVDALYARNEVDFRRGTFRVTGDTVDVYLAYDDMAYRISFFDDVIEDIESFDPVGGRTFDSLEKVFIYPASVFVVTKERIEQALDDIIADMHVQVDYFTEQGKMVEAKRLFDRVNYDVEMIRELGYCSGIENYSRYFDGRQPGARPFCLLDYFPDDFITIIDESHVTIPQIRAMYGGDYSRKRVLVDFGFRLPAAIDNRPLKYDEFEQLIGQTIFVSATPGDYELALCGGKVVEQVIRPTGLLDPPIDVRPSLNQIDDLMAEIDRCTSSNERVLVITLTKRMAEELAKYFVKNGIKCRYIHSDVDTLERVEILESLRNGAFDVLIGVNLLREGLDLPEVSLVAIFDADKEGFLRSERSLTQTAGRAARHLNGKVIMYADTITTSMRRTIDETNRRREKQLAYNEQHNITPKQIIKAARQSLVEKTQATKYYVEPIIPDVAADPVISYMSEEQLKKLIDKTKASMLKAAEGLDFSEAARLRDEMYELEKMLKNKKN